MEKTEFIICENSPLLDSGGETVIIRETETWI